MGLFAWLVLGLIAGVVAQFVTKEKPGKGCTGIIVTAVVGIVGAVVGGFIGSALGWGKVDEFDGRSILLAIVGAVVVLLAFGAIRKR